MTRWLLFHLASGDALWSATALMSLAVVVFIASKGRWRRVIGTVLVVIALLAWWGSGTPTPTALILVGIVVLIAWLGVELKLLPNGKSVRTLCRVAMLIVVCLVVAVELPWHFRPSLKWNGTGPIYVVGDSVSAGLGHPEILPWPQVLAHTEGLEVTNLAVAGATAKSAFRQLQGIDGRGLVLVEIGGNDMFGGSTPQQFAEDLQRLLADVIKTGNPLIMLELPVWPGGRPYARVQREVASRLRVEMIPKRGWAVVASGEGNTLDNVHLSGKGHRAMAAFVGHWVSGWRTPDSQATSRSVAP